MNSNHLRVVGSASLKHDAFNKVTGEAAYTDDLVIADMVYGGILRSPYPHARVRKIHTSEAEKVPGFLALLLSQDVPQTLFNPAGDVPSPLLIKDEKILTDHPLHVGDRIAAVAAVSPLACKEALKKLSVEYEPLPAIFSIEEALADESPTLHSHISPSNMLEKFEVNAGDIEIGFKHSDYVFEEEFFTPSVHHVCMEPAGCICHYTREGKLIIRSTSQTAFQERRILSELLNLPETKIRIIKPSIGGGFGSKSQLHNQHVAALLSKKINRPVKIINTREEEMSGSSVRHESLCRLRVGVSKEGLLQAFHAKVHLNTGAYVNHGKIVLAAHSRKLQYRTPHYKYEGYCVYTNTSVAGAWRGYGNTQLTFAREVMLDNIAEKLNIDPLQFRLKNHLTVGDKIPGSSDILESCAIKNCVEAGEKIKKQIDNEETGINQGQSDFIKEAWGIAFAMHTSGPSNKSGKSSSLILVNDDGSVNLLSGSADIGQGSETALCQIAAEALGISLTDLSITSVDTLHSAYDTGTFGSSQAYVAGNAVLAAAENVRQKICSALATRYEIDNEQVQFKEGVFIIQKDDETASLSFKDAVSKISFGAKGSVIIGSADYKPKTSPPPFAVCWAKVVYDESTGSIEIRHIIETVDVGTVVNQDIVTGQIHGGIGMGFGTAVMEHIEMNRRANGPLTNDLLNYKIPTTLDMPEIHSSIVESFEPTGPFGAKSVGELPVIPVAPAIINAVRRATGDNIKALPVIKRYGIRRIRECI